MIRLLTGDCRMTLPTLPEKSVHACITSPPYWGLRDYGTPPLVWGGIDHEHEWQAAHTAGWHVGTATGVATSTLSRSAAEAQARNKASITGNSMGSRCLCGAWLGSLGLEPTPELFVEHLVECFRHVWRVLRDDGTCWVNLGDSYAGSGKGPTGWNGIGNQARRQGFAGGPDLRAKRSERPREPAKPKDLMEIPSMVAQALRADGWYLRSRIPWLKRNSMPESVTDRPATAVEYVFLLSKSKRYYWDADAVRQPLAALPHAPGNRAQVGDIKRNDIGTERMSAVWGSEAGRNRRNSDWFFESWQGLLLDEHDDPLALVVNPAPFKGSHFAVFPPKLVEPMLKASTSEKGCCPTCGAPWERVTTTEYLPTDRKPPPNKGQIGAMGERAANLTRDGWIPNRDPVRATTGWQPTCAHPEAQQPVPCTVLDLFGGAGTVGLVADRLGRNAVLCELSESYSPMATNRIVSDAPMFAEIDVA